MIRLSALIDEQRPVLSKFVCELGYSEDLGAKFADGYIVAVQRLPTLGSKIEALAHMEDSCMTAGFKAARIREDDALARFQEKNRQ